MRQLDDARRVVVGLGVSQEVDGHARDASYAAPPPAVKRRLANRDRSPYGGRLAATLDHLLWGCRDLDVAIAALRALSGVEAAPGGSHPDLGTRNALARLGPHAFLELIAPDPALASGALARRLAKLAEPTLIMWAARTPDAAALARRAEAAGYAATVVAGERTQPDGHVLRWVNTFVADHGAGVLVPFFIEWGDTPHPALAAPAGLELTSFAIETSQPTSLRSVFEALDVKVAVRKGARDRLVARLATPRGPIALTGP